LGGSILGSQNFAILALVQFFKIETNLKNLGEAQDELLYDQTKNINPFCVSQQAPS
jgi:hypothetical protein